MSQAFKAEKITDKVYWVGAIDWGIRNFHGYATSRGTTYNAFLIMDKTVTLIDTVKAPFFDEMMARIASVTDPSTIATIVSNHSEMDHSGGLPRAIEAIKPETVYASKMGGKALDEHFGLGDAVRVVATGDEIGLGDTSLSFVETRMLHWPDSMVSYLSGERVLFSQDIFGMHLAGLERFDDRIDEHILHYEATKYYANIITLYGNFVQKALPAVDKLSPKVDLICPDHGPVWRSHFDWIRERYGAWSQQKPTNKAVVVYDTMWNSTAALARAIADGLHEAGAAATVMPLSSCHRSDVATEMLESGALIVGSPTLNNGIFPTVADVLCYLKGLRFENKIGAAFGSYGWGGEAVKALNGLLTDMGVEVVTDGYRVKYVPDAGALAQARSFGRDIGQQVVQRAEA